MDIEFEIIVLKWFFGKPLSHMQVIPNNSVLSYISFIDKEEIDPIGADGPLYPRLDVSRILLRCNFLLELVEDTWA